MIYLKVLPLRINSQINNLKNNIIMKKEFYVTPELMEFEISTEGVLCQSPGAGAGDLGENEWAQN